MKQMNDVEKAYYIAGPINNFLKEKFDSTKETFKEFQFRNWDAAFDWACDVVFKLHELGIDNVYCPHLYTIPYAKKLYDKIGDDRDYWLKLDYFYLNKLGPNTTILMSDTAVEYDNNMRQWISEGCFKEYQYGIEHKLTIEILESYFQGEPYLF